MTAQELDTLVRQIGDELLIRVDTLPASAAQPSAPACGCGAAAATAPPRASTGSAEAPCPDWQPPKEGIASLIDHTMLHPDVTESGITELCLQARTVGFKTVCVQPTWVAHAVHQLQGSRVGIGTVVGFPHGTSLTPVKCQEAEQALKLGASELDMVLNVGALKSGRLDEACTDIHCVVEAAGSAGAVVKVILETGLLTEEEKITACVLARLAGAHFVKTSTGFNGPSATVDDVSLMHRVVGGEMGIKAAGGIRSHDQLVAMMKAGATRIGSSCGMEILQQARA